MLSPWPRSPRIRSSRSCRNGIASTALTSTCAAFSRGTRNASATSGARAGPQAGRGQAGAGSGRAGRGAPGQVCGPGVGTAGPAVPGGPRGSSTAPGLGSGPRPRPQFVLDASLKEVLWGLAGSPVVSEPELLSHENQAPPRLRLCSGTHLSLHLLLPPPPPSQPLPFEKGLLPQLWAGAFADAAGEERAVAFPPLLAQNGWGHPRGAIRVGRSGGFAGSRGGRGEMRGQ